MTAHLDLLFSWSLMSSSSSVHGPYGHIYICSNPYFCSGAIADPAKTWPCVHLLFRLCVAPGGQEHDPPDGVLGGGQAPAVGAVGRLGRYSRGGRRRTRGAAGTCGACGGCPPELVTEGLLDLVSP